MFITKKVAWSSSNNLSFMCTMYFLIGCKYIYILFLIGCKYDMTSIIVLRADLQLCFFLCLFFRRAKGREHSFVCNHRKHLDVHSFYFRYTNVWGIRNISLYINCKVFLLWNGLLTRLLLLLFGNVSYPVEMTSYVN